MKKINFNGRYSSKTATVDDEDYEFLSKFKWGYAHGYALLQNPIDKKMVSMHRLLMKPKVGEVVDHINGDPTDNRRINLRICTHKQNSINQPGRKGSSIYKGVCWDKQMQKWRANIRANDKNIFIGLFENERHAAMACDIFSKEYHGEFARLNFE